MKILHGEKLFKMETAWRYLMVEKCVKWKPHGDTSQRKMETTSRYWGHAVAQLVETLRYKPEGRGFDSRWCH